VQEAASIEKLMESLSEITADVNRVTSGLAELITSEKGSIQQIVRNVEDLTGRADSLVARSSDEVEAVLGNAQVISENLRQITSGKDEDISAIVSNVREITEEAKRALHAFRGGMGEGDEAGIAGTLANLDRSISHLESITAKIDRGEGTVGKLISDERLGERVSLAVEGVSDYVNRLSALRTEIALRAEYLFRAGAAKNYVSLRLIPAPDKYFLVEVVDDPLGFTSRETVIRSPPGEEEAAHQEIRTTTDALKFSAQIAKRYSFFAIRFGLIESTGGFGVDLHLLQERLQVNLDLFDFARPEADLPRLRAYANLYLIPHLYLTGGVDDMMNRAQFDPLTGAFQLGIDYFVGGGIFFTDEDLKVLFGTITGGLP
jgi:phospholipid/cholesterol/gamma-HCH transport system substrate-binding protein